MINKKSKIYVAGHQGMVGSSLVRLLQKKGYSNLLTKTKNQPSTRMTKKINKKKRTKAKKEELTHRGIR